MILRRQILWTPSGAKDFDRLPAEVQEQIYDGLYHLVQTGSGDLQHLAGAHGVEWRLRVGDYRVRFTLYDGSLLVLRARKRGEAYRD